MPSHKFWQINEKILSKSLLNMFVKNLQLPSSGAPRVFLHARTPSRILLPVASLFLRARRAKLPRAILSCRPSSVPPVAVLHRLLSTRSRRQRLTSTGTFWKSRVSSSSFVSRCRLGHRYGGGAAVQRQRRRGACISLTLWRRWTRHGRIRINQ